MRGRRSVGVDGVQAEQGNMSSLWSRRDSIKASINHEHQGTESVLTHAQRVILCMAVALSSAGVALLQGCECRGQAGQGASRARRPGPKEGLGAIEHPGSMGGRGVGRGFRHCQKWVCIIEGAVRHLGLKGNQQEIESHLLGHFDKRGMQMDVKSFLLLSLFHRCGLGRFSWYQVLIVTCSARKEWILCFLCGC